MSWVLSIIMIAVVGAIGYIWAARGFFSALVHMICVIIAGAVALGVWEPLAYMLLTKFSEAWEISLVWGLALAVPFAVTLALLRVATNKLLPANADLDGVSNLIGGGVCGIVSGTLTAGILMISISFLGLTQEFFYFKGVDFDNTGCVKRNDTLLFPVDRITVGFYGLLSQTAFSAEHSLAKYRPALVDDGALLRTNFNDGGSRHTLPPSAFEVLGRYTVGPVGAEPPPAGTKPDDLLIDSLSDKGSKKQTVTDLSGDKIATAGSHLEGFVVNFKAGAREKAGGIVIGNAQIQLVCRDADDTESIALQPIAMISQQEGSRRDLGRWRYDAPRNFFRSAGGSTEAQMGFEFLVPRGYTPLALYVKGVRTDVSELQPYAKYPWTTQRDSAVKSGAIFTSVVTGGAGPLDRSSTTTVKLDATNITQDSEVLVTNYLLDGVVISTDNMKSLETDEERRIVNGDGEYFNTEFKDMRGVSQQLQVRAFAPTEDTRIVQVRVSVKSRIGFLSSGALAADLKNAPVLVDDADQRYAAIGYMYKDNTTTHIHFMPGSPIRSVNELPQLSSSRPDQDLILIFRVSEGVKITDFAIGDKAVGTFKPPVEMPKVGN